MRTISLVAVLATALAHAEDAVSPLTFTYMTLLQGNVETATTIYALESTSASSVASPVTSTSSARAAPTFSATTAPISTTSIAVSSSAGSYWNDWPWFRSWPHNGHGPGTDDGNEVYGWIRTGLWPPHPDHPTAHPSAPPSQTLAVSGPSASGSSASNTRAATPLSSGSSSSSSSSASATPTRYTANPADLAYPNFSVPAVPSALSSNGSFYSTEAIPLILDLKNDTPQNCQSCKDVMTGLQQNMRTHQDLLGNIAYTFCAGIPFIPEPICVGLLKVASPYIGGVMPAMDMQGDDGTLLCAFMLGLCPIPPVPKLDLDVLFKGTKKPAHKPRTPSTKKPLKVLHISDYHLDERYVVGSEANCGGALCCRVFPYTNLSAPILEPASLFGSYQCDTPEAMATSVFRSVPKATNLTWSDFSFGIFTGDLVSHDIWELTPEYVQAEELISYQQFFDGLSGVAMYPTLGNHDTYPHAFTAWPLEDDVLPANVSYPEQQLGPNYEPVSAAWRNYGWLSANEAAGVVSSGLGIYRAVTAEGLVIISLNSDAWYYFNFYAYIGANEPDSTGALAILVDWLLEAERASQAVWLMQHVNVGGSTDYEALPAPTDLFYQIVDRFNETIRATFFGHTHNDEFGVFYANNATEGRTADTATAPAYIMPSVTTYQNLNGGWRYYVVDAASFDVLDSVTYYANVSNAAEWTAAGDVAWEFEYSARETYGYAAATALQPGEPLSAAWWHAVAEEISNNETTFRTYTDLRNKLYRPYTAPTVANRNLTLCGLMSMSIPLFEDCLGTTKSTTSFL